MSVPDALLSFEGQNQHAGADHDDAGPFPAGWALAEKADGENGHQQQAELVHRCDFGGVPDLQGAEVAHPRCAGRQAGEDQERPGLGGKLPRIAPLAGDLHKQGQHRQEGKFDEITKRAAEFVQIVKTARV